MKILIAGLGSIGRRHLRNLVALGEKDLILYRSHKATLPDDELKGYPVETDLTVALKKHQPQAVIIANPTALHMDVSISAAKAGCAIFLEKPIAADLLQVDELRLAVAKGGSKILVGFQFRYHPTLIKARELITAGLIGKVLTAHAHWGEYLPNWHPWEDYRQSYAARADLGGGVIVTLTHPLDYLRFLLGEVDSLWSLNGHISPLELNGVEDVAEIGLKFSSGATGGVHVNYFQRPPVHRLEIVGTGGSLHWDNADGRLTHYQMPDDFGSIHSQPTPAQVTHYALPDGFDRNNLFITQMQHFLNIANGKAEPVCTLDDGIRALEIALAAKTSQAEGHPVSWQNIP
jgi:predicted dehydrogenase